MRIILLFGVKWYNMINFYLSKFILCQLQPIHTPLFSAFNSFILFLVHPYIHKFKIIDPHFFQKPCEAIVIGK